jgi:ribosomal protein S18 acetylase RimI-like enzyme
MPANRCTGVHGSARVQEHRRDEPADQSLAFGNLREQADAERYIPATLPWVYDATWPKFDGFLGGADAARSLLADWMARESSETSIRRATLLFEDEHPIGGFIALSGPQIATCRRADTLATIGAVSSDRRHELTRHLRTVANLYLPVDADQFYLSRLGVAAERRGADLGRKLMYEYLGCGRRAGFTRFRLDVSADNHVAISLYRALGFAIAAVRRQGTDAVIAMTREQSPPVS